MLVGAFVERRVRTLTAVTLLYIALYSLLPHKEVGMLALPHELPLDVSYLFENVISYGKGVYITEDCPDPYL